MENDITTTTEKTRVTKFSLRPGVERIFEDIECLVIIYGKNLGKKYDLLDDEITIGRDIKNTIIIDADSVSRKHAKLCLKEDKWLIFDLKSTNGTFVNDLQLVEGEGRILQSGDLIKVGDTIFKFLSGSNIESAYYEEIYRMTIIDGLTLVYNKRYLIEFLEKEMSRTRRHHRNLSILMLDIDLFKKINDIYGHLIGDFILKELTKVISARVRKEEVFARFGGEEFIAVLPETNLESAVKFGEILRRMIEAHIFKAEGKTIPVTISVGVVEFDPLKHKFVEDLIKDVDSMLYKAKNTGRNRICY